MEHFFQALPGPDWFNARHIYAEAVERANDGAILVELGAWKGRSAACMGVEIANSGKRLAFFTVDTWLGSSGEAEHLEDEDVRHGRLLEVFTRNIQPVRHLVVPIRSLSVEAAARFEDESIEFLFVDAAHTYEGVRDDLNAWWPKVRPGGMVAGDDWNFAETSGRLGVREAVDEFVRSMGQKLYLRPGDPCRDWYQWEFVKA